MTVHFGIRGNLAWSDVINWPNPFLFLYVGTTVSILFPNSVCLSHFLKTSHHGFYTTSIVLCCPDLSLQTSSWGLTQISFAAIPHCFQFWTTHSQKDQDCIWFVSALAFQFISTHSAQQSRLRLTDVQKILNQTLQTGVHLMTSNHYLHPVWGTTLELLQNLKACMIADVKPSARIILIYRSCFAPTPHSYWATLLAKVGIADGKHSLRNSKGWRNWLIRKERARYMKKAKGAL